MRAQHVQSSRKVNPHVFIGLAEKHEKYMMVHTQLVERIDHNQEIGVANPISDAIVSIMGKIVDFSLEGWVTLLLDLLNMKDEVELWKFFHNEEHYCFHNIFKGERQFDQLQSHLLKAVIAANG